MAVAEKQLMSDGAIKALSSPIRREVLHTLKRAPDGGMSPSMLAKKMNKPLGVVSYHVRKLAKAELLTLVDVQPRRGAQEHFYKRVEGDLDKQVSKILRIFGKN